MPTMKFSLRKRVGDKIGHSGANISGGQTKTVTAFGQEDEEDEDEDEEEDVEEGFLRDVRARKKKVEQKLGVFNEDMEKIVNEFERGQADEVDGIDDVDEVNEDNEVEQDGQKLGELKEPKKLGELKYMGKLLESKKRRMEDQLIARQEQQDKRGRILAPEVVFESEAYKRQKNDIARIKQEQEKLGQDVASGSFYSNILRMRHQGDGIEVGEDDHEKSEQLEELEKLVVASKSCNEETTPVVVQLGTKPPVLPQLYTELNEKSIDTYKTTLKLLDKFTEKIKALIASKLSTDDIAEYRQRYLQRSHK